MVCDFHTRWVSPNYGLWFPHSLSFTTLMLVISTLTEFHHIMVCDFHTHWVSPHCGLWFPHSLSFTTLWFVISTLTVFHHIMVCDFNTHWVSPHYGLWFPVFLDSHNTAFISSLFYCIYMDCDWFSLYGHMKYLYLRLRNSVEVFVPDKITH